MPYLQMWNDLKETLLEKKFQVRNKKGKRNLNEVTLSWVLREMQKVDPTITDAMLTHPGDDKPITDGF
ncbi:hypothetical protein HYG86_11385 [Alkalicella caledoniensis]|uniref:Uncharacterized protein n=1 Tax=Alkalicella caledoniensis TaxID=2731377 RepID=A0A7G9W9G3_ALKCA|nr:hypothetical protein [Alkalicella caledoniensis]QNO15325.1 hypothetical protein HYG86_11385 [Alkalicella caledoniensis]